MKFIKRALLFLFGISLIAFFVYILTGPKNKDPLKTELIFFDIDNFWLAYNKSKPNFDPVIFQEIYLDKGSKGVKNYISNRIQSAEHLSKVIKRYPKYYASIQKSTNSVSQFEDQIRHDLIKMKELYPNAVFPPVYFVVGGLNSGGTSFRNGLIIGVEMYGLTSETPDEELSDWHKTVLKSINEIPHIVIHELVHFQQNKSLLNQLRSRNLLSASIQEGAADFLAELISGKHINNHIHEFANPREEELWIEFKKRMKGNDYSGWLNSSSKGRPNDLGYWMGYKITKSYYDNALDKKKAIDDIINIRDFEKFLELSKYSRKFDN